MLTKSQKILSALAAIFYCLAGVLHFLKPAMYLKIVPPYVPLPLIMIYLSGAAEIAGGLGLLIPAVRRGAALGLIALLVAVFPANLYMATNPVASGAIAIPVAVLWGRLLLQPILMWWIWWCSKPTA